MSDILIKGMEMPKNLGVSVTIYPDGRVIRYLGYGAKEQLGVAVPVPTPHGRLGDLDKLAEKIDGIWDCNDLYFQPNDHICDPDDCKGCKWRETWDCFRRMVKHATTIIPAEEESAE